LKGNSSTVSIVAFSPDSKRLASALDDKTILLWDTTTGTPGKKLTGYRDSVIALAYSPDGSTLASASCEDTVS
ncbi:hypothetical protein MYCTH_50538, partial [Thermothelomyces thermophilus ATCC 42464]